MDEGRSASQKPKPNKSQAGRQEQEPSLFLLLSSQRVLRPEFQNRTKIVPLKTAPLGAGEQGRTVGAKAKSRK